MWKMQKKWLSAVVSALALSALAGETIDVTDSLKPSGNILEVEAVNVPRSSRWYPGSGIFRDVTVRICPRDHVKPNTLFVRTLEGTRLVSLCSGDPSSREDFRGSSMRMFHGLLVAAVEGPAEGLVLAE